jgi:hypothetical protein
MHLKTDLPNCIVVTKRLASEDDHTRGQIKFVVTSHQTPGFTQMTLQENPRSIADNCQAGDHLITFPASTLMSEPAYEFAGTSPSVSSWTTAC